MDPRILAVIEDYPQWRGDVYRLAMLIVEAQKTVCREQLVAAGLPESAEVI
jgi:hypothetical protein